MNQKKGLTLIEVLVTIALLSIVIAGSAGLLNLGLKTQTLTMDEFDIQSNLRNASLHVNTIVRDTSAVYLLHRENANNLTPEWNYVMLSPDADKLFNYVWNSSTKKHDVQELFTGISGVTLDLIFTKYSAPTEDNLLGFSLKVKSSGVERSIDTELEAKNSLQIVDRSYLNTANTLAYRNDSRLDEVSNAQAVVSLVLDKSGSMANRMDGKDDTKDSGKDASKYSRMKLMKQEATRLVEELGKLPNINISLNPFDSTANGSSAVVNAKTQLSVLKNSINSLTAKGGTNTGDGIRRGFYRIKEFNEQLENVNKTNKNFMIILVDGVTTFASIHEEVTAHSIDTTTYRGTTWQYNGLTYEYSHSKVISSRGNQYTNYYYSISPYSKYVTGNGSIDNNEGDKNISYPNGRYYGNGNSIDPNGKEYVNIIGEMVKNYKQGTNEEIKVYVIGFSAVKSDYGSLKDIAVATTGESVFYEAGSSKALEEIFKAIQRDISDALWHIGGPN